MTVVTRNLLYLKCHKGQMERHGDEGDVKFILNVKGKFWENLFKLENLSCEGKFHMMWNFLHEGTNVIWVSI